VIIDAVFRGGVTEREREREQEKERA